MKRMEGYFLEKRYYTKSLDDESEYAESNSECDEYIDNYIASCECEDEDF